MGEEGRLKKEAEWCRLGLEYGLIGKADVVAWADGEIERTSHPAPILTDISLAATGSSQDILGLLRTVPGRIDDVAVRRRFLGELATLFRSKSIIATRLAHILYQMALCGDAPDERAASEMRRYEDEFEIAKYTGGNEAEIAARMLAFLDDQCVEHREVKNER